MTHIISAFLFLATLCMMTMPTMAQDKHDFSNFEQIPILDNGRIKPIGAFAKARLKDFYGKDTNATAWLAETLFNPSQAASAKIFTIKDAALKKRLGLNNEKTHFNLADLQNGLQKTQKDVIALLQGNESDLTAEQKSLLKIHEDVVSYNELLRSFSMLLPLADGDTLQNILPKEKRILSDLKSIIAEKGENIEVYSPEEQKTAFLSFQLQQIRQGGSTNDDLKIIPTNLNDELTWIAPWQILNEGKGSPQTSQALAIWSDIITSYREKDFEQWNKSTKTALDYALQNSNSTISKTRLNTELIYQEIKPYHVAMALYALSIFLIILSTFKPSKYVQTSAFIALIGALLFQTFGIGARIFILDRPPVGTLYESVLFVSLICAIISAITWIKTRKSIIPLTGQIAALGLLAIAPTMLQNNDSLELLVAVLNTNFWLATHVLCITAGYGVCIIAGCLGHTYMLLRLKNKTHTSLQTLFQSIHKTGLIALLLTAVGTVLGGIWADQSWGRFWGWDPKENGALLIVLWLIWAQHGRLSGNIRPLGYVAAIAAINVIVALAWFGVNLLGVGLHSYGFTSGIASGLAAFCIIETIIILALWAAIRHKEKKP